MATRGQFPNIGGFLGSQKYPGASKRNVFYAPFPSSIGAEAGTVGANNLGVVLSEYFWTDTSATIDLAMGVVEISISPQSATIVPGTVTLSLNTVNIEVSAEPAEVVPGPLTDFDEYQTKNRTGLLRRIPFAKDEIASPAAGKMYSLFTLDPFAGSTPSTATTCDSSTVGNLKDFLGETSMRLGKISIACRSMVTLTLCDRLSHQGGLSAGTASAQTTNLPTAALTRYTDGVGVMAAVEIYSAAGPTARTLAATYTNSSATSGKVSPGIEIGGTDFQEANRFMPITLASGDVGIRSVESVQLSATTGASGNIGITLYKPLKTICYTGDSGRSYLFDSFMYGFDVPIVKQGACLFWVISQSRALSTSEGTGDITGEICFF